VRWNSFQLLKRLHLLNLYQYNKDTQTQRLKMAHLAPSTFTCPQWIGKGRIYTNQIKQMQITTNIWAHIASAYGVQIKTKFGALESRSIPNEKRLHTQLLKWRFYHYLTYIHIHHDSAKGWYINQIRQTHRTIMPKKKMQWVSYQLWLLGPRWWLGRLSYP
jgi:hypothetical protein